jgi:enterobactin synthetase component D
MENDATSGRLHIDRKEPSHSVVDTTSTESVGFVKGAPFYNNAAFSRELAVCPFPLRRVGFHSIAGLPAEFDDSLYVQNRIDLPDRVAHSVMRRRKEFYFGRLCAREAVRQIMPDFIGQIEIGEGGRPLFPAGIAGSITHDANRAAAICQPAEYGRLGLDMEPVMTSESAAELWQQIAMPNELALASWRNATEALRLTLIFSAKEALFKAIYADILHIADFHTSAVVEVEMPAGRMVLRLEEDLGGPWCRGRKVAASFLVDADRVLTLVCTTTTPRN